MYIKSTNENITSLQDVYNSLDEHLGQEYTDTIKSIIDNTNDLIPTEEVEKLEKDYRADIDRLEQNIDYYINGYADIDIFCGEIITYTQNAKRLNKKELITKLKDLQKQVKSFY